MTDETHTNKTAMAKAPLIPMPECWRMVTAVIPHTRRAILFGPPGTGKTFIGMHSAESNQPVYTITLTEDTPMSEIRGHFVPQGDTFRWMHGPAVRAWLDGARLVINEINRASPEAQTFLFAILDDMESAQVMLPTGEIVKPAESFSCVATMNGELSELPEALLDRFPVRIRVNEVHPDAIRRLPEYLQRAALITTNVQEDNRRVSIRAWLAFDQLLSAKVDYDTAGSAVFGDKWEAIEVAHKIRNAKRP